MRPKTLDHVALWVADRDRIAAFCCDHLGMHEIANEERFTLVGNDAKHGKLTLFEADGPRERGALLRIGLRVSDLEQALDALPPGTDAEFELADGLRIRLLAAATSVDSDLDHVALLASDPETAADESLSLGFEPTESAAD